MLYWIHQMETSLGSLQNFALADFELHRIIADAAHNPFIRALYGVIELAHAFAYQRLVDAPEEEVLVVNGASIAPAGARAFNPAFDVTPARLVTGLITERGVAAGAQCSEQRTFGLYFCQSDRADQLRQQVAPAVVRPQPVGGRRRRGVGK